jgi:hypothetical protein
MAPQPAHRPLVWAADVVGHPQEFIENVFDYGHIPELHKWNHEEISPPQPDGPFYRTTIRLTRRLPLLGLPARQSATLTILGLGGVHVSFDLVKYGLDTSIWTLTSPTGPWTMRVWAVAISDVSRRRVAAPTKLRAALNRSAAHAISRGMLPWLVRDLQADLEIWHHKKYLPHPGLAKGDGPIGAYRQWTRQFYPDDGQPGKADRPGA